MDIDHLILKVNELDASVAFYTEVMGFSSEGMQDPFAVIRVSDTFQLQLAPWGTEGFEHLAFAVSQDQFDAIFSRVKDRAIDYGPSFHDVGEHNVGDNVGPGEEVGAKGAAPTLYFYDPNKHLIEIRTYS